jgi:hypothetical protein
MLTIAIRASSEIVGLDIDRVLKRWAKPRKKKDKVVLRPRLVTCHTLKIRVKVGLSQVLIRRFCVLKKLLFCFFRVETATGQSRYTSTI